VPFLGIHIPLSFFGGTHRGRACLRILRQMSRELPKDFANARRRP
jgi:hypothetical protein